MTHIVTPLIAGIGAPEILLILLVLVLLFGASKLPELARGSGRALRIFKAETKGLMDDDEKSDQDHYDQGAYDRGRPGPHQIEPRDGDVQGHATETAREPRPDSER